MASLLLLLSLSQAQFFSILEGYAKEKKKKKSFFKDKVVHSFLFLLSLANERKKREIGKGVFGMEFAPKSSSFFSFLSILLKGEEIKLHVNVFFFHYFSSFLSCFLQNCYSMLFFSLTKSSLLLLRI
ncbi:hypothetical protein Csa_021913 [Cucumis sativus]|nr:hypothetical protein Csa_021913 [Cucumis sativus]